MLQHMYGYIRGCITVVYPGHAGGPADVLGDVLADVLGDVLADVRDDIFRDVRDVRVGPHGAAQDPLAAANLLMELEIPK